jgi:hypothetical protein
MRLISSMLVVVAVVACGVHIATPSIDEVAGSYRATGFTTTDRTGSTNQLARGATFTIVLATNGTTTGRLFIPGGGSGGSDLDADLTGAWTLNGAVVRFAHDADTFVRDMPFTPDLHNGLSAEQTFSGVSISVVLRK